MNCLRINLALVMITLTHSIGQCATLRGKVETDDGSPIAGAVVDIYSAKPQSGAAVTCPSCYRDCAKQVTVGADGSFKLNDLDSTLLFRVLVMAPGFRSTLTDFIDPDQEPLNLRLNPIPQDIPADRRLTGRVLDDHGQPLAGAIVYPRGAKTAEKRWWGTTPGVDEASITDQHGRFIITSQDPKLGLDVGVRATGFANVPMQFLELNGQDHEIRMQRGASVSVSLAYKGRPMAGRSIGLVQTDRSPTTFAGEQVAETDSSGAMQFNDLQPHQEYVIYSVCERTQKLGEPILRTQRLVTGGPGEATQVKELQFEPGVTLKGRVQFPSGAQSPKQCKLRLDRSPAWDWYEITLGEGGEFQIDGLPAEAYTIRVIASGFEIDPSQFRYQIMGPAQFAMRLRSDPNKIVDVSIPMRPIPPADKQ